MHEPTPEERELFRKRLAELEKQGEPGEYHIILDAGDDDDAHGPAPPPEPLNLYDDVSLEEQERIVQEVLKRKPTGPNPPQK